MTQENGVYRQTDEDPLRDLLAVDVFDDQDVIIERKKIKKVKPKTYAFAVVSRRKWDNMHVKTKYIYIYIYRIYIYIYMYRDRAPRCQE